MTVWRACSKCFQPLLYTNTGASYFASQISYSNINGSYFAMYGLKRQAFYDTDGTLTNNVFDSKTRTSAVLAYGYEHLLQDAACARPNNPTLWDSATLCEKSTVRHIMFTHFTDKTLFLKIPIHVRLHSNF